MSSTPILRDSDSRSHDLTTISMVDSLLVTGLLCAVIWSLMRGPAGPLLLFGGYAITVTPILFYSNKLLLFESLSKLLPITLSMLILFIKGRACLLLQKINSFIKRQNLLLFCA